MFSQIKDRLQSLVNEGMETDKAAARVRSMILESAESTESVVDEAIDLASRYIFREEVRRVRRRICSDARQGASDRLKEKATSLMKFRLPHGGFLSESTGAECVQAAQVYHKLAATNKMRGDFLKEVSRRVKPNQLVGSVLSECELSKIYSKVEIR